MLPRLHWMCERSGQNFCAGHVTRKQKGHVQDPEQVSSRLWRRKREGDDQGLPRVCRIRRAGWNQPSPPWLRWTQVDPGQNFWLLCCLQPRWWSFRKLSLHPWRPLHLPLAKIVKIVWRNWSWRSGSSSMKLRWSTWAHDPWRWGEGCPCWALRQRAQHRSPSSGLFFPLFPVLPQSFYAVAWFPFCFFVREFGIVSFVIMV